MYELTCHRGWIHNFYIFHYLKMPFYLRLKYVDTALHIISNDADTHYTTGQEICLNILFHALGQICIIFLSGQVSSTEKPINILLCSV